jgi:predicted transposase/invertase (TIGR01784 family)
VRREAEPTRRIFRDQNTSNHRYLHVTPSPHDSLFRAAFSAPERAAALLRRILPRPLVDAIRWDTLEGAQGVFVDRKLDPHATDLLFRAELIGYPDEVIYILLEHQSRVDPDMPLRCVDYVVCLCKEKRKHCSAHELPTIVPVVVSHAVGGWRRPRSFDDMFTCRPDSLGIADHVPRFTMLHLDVTQTNNAELRSFGADAFAVATLWALREARNGESLLIQFESFADVLRAMVAGPNGRDEAHTWLRYILLVSSEVTAEALIAAVLQHAPQLEELTMTAAEQLRQEGREQGIEQGIEQGHHRGQVELLAWQLTQRFGPIPAPYRERLADANTDQLCTLAGRILTARSLDELFAEFTRDA